jgi:hypothetical protein
LLNYEVTPKQGHPQHLDSTAHLKEEDYKQGKLVLMWDKRKGQPNTCKESDKFWLGPYKIEKKSVDDSYYISTLEGRRLPLPIIRSLFKPHLREET